MINRNAIPWTQPFQVAGFPPLSIATSTRNAANSLTGDGTLIDTVAVGRLGDRDVIVTGGTNGTVRIWEATSRPIGDPLTGHTDTVNAVALGQLGGREV
jgi:WD40 repeat protein